MGIDEDWSALRFRRMEYIKAPETSLALVNVPKLRAFCRRFPSATETLYEEPYNFLVYAVGGRKFAYFKTSEPERWRFSTRVTPSPLHRADRCSGGEAREIQGA